MYPYLWKMIDALSNSGDPKKLKYLLELKEKEGDWLVKGAKKHDNIYSLSGFRSSLTDITILNTQAKEII